MDRRNEANLNEVFAQVNKGPAPSPDTPSTSAGSRRSANDNVPSTSTGKLRTTASVKRLALDPKLLAEIRRITPNHRLWNSKPSTMILKKIELLRSATHHPVTYRDAENYPLVTEKVFITLESKAFKDKKICVQKEDIFKDKHLQLSTGDRKLSDVLQYTVQRNALRAFNISQGPSQCLPQHESEYDGDDGSSSEGEFEGPVPARGGKFKEAVLDKKFNRTVQNYVGLDKVILSLEDKGATVDIPPRAPLLIQKMAECPTTSQRSSTPQDKRGQDDAPVPLTTGKKPQNIPQSVLLVPPTPNQNPKNAPNPQPPRQANVAVRQPANIYPHPSADNPGLFVIGRYGTTITTNNWETINWSQSPAVITRRILMCLFDRRTLATHTFPSRSLAFRSISKPEKLPLDKKKIADIISLVTSNVKTTSKDVKTAIITKCVDESKMFRLREEKTGQVLRCMRGPLS